MFFSSIKQNYLKKTNGFVIIKCDDFYELNENVNKLNEIIYKYNIKVSWGIIGGLLRNKDAIDFVKKERRGGHYHFFNHGYYHYGSGDEEGYEFENKAINKQIEYILMTQEIVKNKCGLILNCFGAPCNHVDYGTAVALSKIPQIKFWYYGINDVRFGIKVLPRSFELEQKVGKPKYTFFLESYEHFFKSRHLNGFGSNSPKYLATIQCHPNKWKDEDFLEFIKFLNFLNRNNISTITPNDLIKNKSHTKSITFFL